MTAIYFDKKIFHCFFGCILLDVFSDNGWDSEMFKGWHIIPTYNMFSYPTVMLIFNI